ncbi:AraC family transcriptional regulator [Planctomycetota bacterium]|nr:AraC family transcriptional regulator [Planctomycetota bacterium]
MADPVLTAPNLKRGWSRINWRRYGGRLGKEPRQDWTPWQRRPGVVLNAVRQGRFTAELASGPIVTAGPDEVLVVAHSALHRVRSQDCRIDYTIVHFKAGPVVDPMAERSIPFVWSGPVGRHLGTVVRRLETAWTTMERDLVRRAIARERAAMDLLSALLDHSTPAEIPAPSPDIHPGMEAVFEIIDRQLSEPLSRAVLARTAGLSIERFAAVFRAATGESPMAFIERERMERALTLLTAGGLAIAEVARQVGFADPFHFSRRFRKHFGVPPSASARDA